MSAVSSKRNTIAVPSAVIKTSPSLSTNASSMSTLNSSPSKSGSANTNLVLPSSPSSNTLRVHLPNGGFNVVKYGQQTRVRELIQAVANRLAATSRPCLNLFGLCVAWNDEFHWLPREKTVPKAREQFDKASSTNARYELRVRYFPSDLKLLHEKDRVTFLYIYDQTRNEYLTDIAEKIDPEVAIQLGCLEIRRFFKDMPHIALDKKSNFDYLEKDVGLRKFFPERLLLQSKAARQCLREVTYFSIAVRFPLRAMSAYKSAEKVLHYARRFYDLKQSLCTVFMNTFSPLFTQKARALRKAIQICFKEFASLTETECILRFFDILKSIHQFDHEAHKCSLGSNWSVPISLVVSSEIGLAYSIERTSPKQLAQLKDIVSIRTLSEGQDRFVIHIRVEGADEMLTLTCQSAAVCDDIADLINGYCEVVTGIRRDMWNRNGEKQQRESRRQSIILSPHLRSQSGGGTSFDHRKSGSLLDSNRSDYAEVVDDIEADYSAPLDEDYVVERSGVSITALDVIGEGHFGNVYRGTYTMKNGESVAVAVKACKESVDRGTTEKFLEEAYIMKQFEHPHIIRLIGVCPEPPIWIVMELAKYGELRAYLLNNRKRLTLPVLLLYCYQLSTALSYLESKNYVHRDIAARNILVAEFDSIKLADFGLSRWVEEESYYKASKGKLPIKWMAPESINFRRFSSASDVWMFAVCVWEILMMGVKPFTGVKNSDVVGLIESGERLETPDNCPTRLCILLSQCWSYEPTKRPNFSVIKMILHEIFDQERKQENNGAPLYSRSEHSINGKDEQAPPKPVLPSSPLSNLNGANNSRSSSSSPSTTSTAAASAKDAHVRPRRPLSTQEFSEHEAAKPGHDSRMVYLGNRLLQQQLKEQLRISEEDDLWLAQAEEEINPRPKTMTNEAHMMTTNRSAKKRHNPALQSLRNEVADAVTAIIRLVDNASGVPDFIASLYENIKILGGKVRSFSAAVDSLRQELQASEHEKIDTSQKRLSGDMGDVVQCLKLLTKFFGTEVEDGYIKGLLAAVKVIGGDVSDLLEVLSDF